MTIRKIGNEHENDVIHLNGFESTLYPKKIGYSLIGLRDFLVTSF